MEPWAVEGRRVLARQCVLDAVDRLVEVATTLTEFSELGLEEVLAVVERPRREQRGDVDEREPAALTDHDHGDATEDVGTILDVADRIDPRARSALGAPRRGGW